MTPAHQIVFHSGSHNDCTMTSGGRVGSVCVCARKDEFGGADAAE